MLASKIRNLDSTTTAVQLYILMISIYCTPSTTIFINESPLNELNSVRRKNTTTQYSCLTIPPNGNSVHEVSEGFFFLVNDFIKNKLRNACVICMHV